MAVLKYKELILSNINSFGSAVLRLHVDIAKSVNFIPWPFDYIITFVFGKFDAKLVLSNVPLFYSRKFAEMSFLMVNINIL